MKLLKLSILTLLLACSTPASNTQTPTQSPITAPSASTPATAAPTALAPSPTTTTISPPCRMAWDNAPVCNMPYSIVVHSAQKDWLAKLAPRIYWGACAGFPYCTSLTYDSLAYDIGLGYPPVKRYMLISIDDLSTYYLPSRFYEMINNMRMIGLVGTLAVVTEYPQPPDPKIWAYYRELQQEGWEIAIHTEHHYNFLWITDEQIELEIRTSYEKICANTLKCPITLILPFGEGAHLPIVTKVARELGIWWIVGTDVGTFEKSYFSGDPPYFVPRAPIVEDVDEMFKALAEMFPFEYSYDNE